jgi:cytochrome c oxidase cbb3-type subunit 3
MNDRCFRRKLPLGALALSGVFGLGLVAGCREERGIGEFRQAPPAGGTPTGAPMVDLRPGPEMPELPRFRNPFAGDRQAIAEGKELWDWFNCSGCHASGGGAIGPPLMDDEWIYGSHDDNLFASIVEGRPKGMPAYGGRITDVQVWQIIAYIRTLQPEYAATGAPEPRRRESADESGKSPGEPKR